MSSDPKSYSFIANEIATLKHSRESFRDKSESYMFSVVCVNAHFYKNPAFVLEEHDIENMMVDGQGDGGVDILLTVPGSETSDLIIGQSKYYQKINVDEVSDAISKMAMFYKNMRSGSMEHINDKAQSRFYNLYSEFGDESKVNFVFYTSAPRPKKLKDNSRFEKQIKELFPGEGSISVCIFWGNDVVEEIKEAASRRATIEYGKIDIDRSDNILKYDSDGYKAIIVNASAYSLKMLYAQHNKNLLNMNLRYHVSGREVDRGIGETIRETPSSFWLKNNGITIICDSFIPDGKEIKLRNFSVINGGQTTYALHRSPNINQEKDLLLPCKIIQIVGDSEDERSAFCLSIAKAANSQKAIKPIDLKANSPEQLRFAKEMRAIGIFYQTKRGEKIPSQYSVKYLNTDLAEVGKLCLAAIFQLPGKCRNKPSTLYEPDYYNLIFDSDQKKIARLAKDLLYINDFFQTRYDFVKSNPDLATNREANQIAGNARTLCIAFMALLARFRQGNISIESLQAFLTKATKGEVKEESIFSMFSKLEGVEYIIPPELAGNGNLDHLDSFLARTFSTIIRNGYCCYTYSQRNESGATEKASDSGASNFLKKDSNYYSILQMVALQNPVFFDSMKLLA